MSITLTDLHYLVLLAEEQHFGKAAERAAVSQPTLSIAMKKLEAHLGVVLFERGNREVCTTGIGQRLVAQAKHILAETRHFEEIAKSDNDQLQGSIRLGVIYTVAPYLLPNLISSITQVAPNLSLYLQENFTEHLLEKLVQNKLDAIVIACPFSASGVVVRTLYQEEFQVLLPVGHRMAQLPTINSQQLAQHDLLLLGKGNCFRDQVVAACPPAEKSNPSTFEASSLETLRYMVASGAGLTVVPNSAAQTWFADPQNSFCERTLLRPFSPPVPTRTLALAWRVSFPRPRAIEALCQAVLANLPAGTTPLSLSAAERDAMADASPLSLFDSCHLADKA